MGDIKRLSIEYGTDHLDIHSVRVSDDGIGVNVLGAWRFMSKEHFKKRLREGPTTAQDVLKWLELHPSKQIEDAELFRWGLVNVTPESPFDLAAKQYEIKRIVCASGKLYRWTPDVYYTPDKHRGGASTFWPIDLHTLKVCQVSDLEGISSPICSDVELSEEEQERLRAKLVCREVQQALYLRRLDDWCMARKDVFRKISVPGARGASSMSYRFRMESVPVFCTTEHGECVRASIANGVKLLELQSSSETKSNEAALSVL